MCYLCTRKTNIGTLAERLGNGLQNRVEQFDSARYLNKKDVLLWHPFLLRNAKPPPVATEKPIAGGRQDTGRRAAERQEDDRKKQKRPPLHSGRHYSIGISRFKVKRLYSG